jgi:hypothetical protein
VCPRQRRLLVTVASGTVDVSDLMIRFARLPNAWENFEASLSAFSAIVEEQRESLKGNVAVEVKEAQSRLDKLASRWAALKPGKEMKSWGPSDVEAVFASLAEWRNNTESVKAAVQGVLDSCETFGLEKPNFGGLAAFEADYAETIASWDMYKTYDTERFTLASQDWISFRSHMFDLQVRAREGMWK